MSDFTAVKYVSVVKGISWKPNYKGKFLPILTLDPPIHVEKGEFDSISGGSFLESMQLLYGVGAIIEVAENEQGFLRVVHAYDPSEDLRAPTQCVGCLNVLQVSGDDLVCTYPRCMVRSTSQVFRLLDYVSENCINWFVPENLLERWLHNFPMNLETRVCADDLVSFLTSFTKSSAKGTSSRFECLLKAGFTQEEADLLHNYEVAVDLAIAKNGIESERFWHLFFPHLLPEDRELPNVDDIGYLGDTPGLTNHLQMRGLTRGEAMLVINDLKTIRFVRQHVKLKG